MIRILGKAFGKVGSGILRFVLALASGMGVTRLFRIPFFIGVFILSFVGTSRLLDLLSIR